ncbi:DNA-3-methyladenine glycosylase [Tissierella carlieri]|uniref:DNA-3-methyladenine glycosylase II n=1 Tax=Tissierella carlieri TaxID=689904 RepID=A0ABT1S7B3_9FIRM|nr:DNA-3-methyladenine glycosylase [Tissierella carlieri]MCQ4922230.1 DNA-3-methyladenine glycosylase [Tissierella carlieri]
MKCIFKLDDECLLHLSNKDPILGKLISHIGDYELELNKNYFVKLISSIIGQQLSVKAADTIFTRVKNLCEEINPQNILSIDDDELRSAGVSRPKIKYIKHLSEEVINNRIDLNNLDDLSDEEVISELTKIKGIGRWTAEMFMIFSLGRLDVFSTADVGLRRAIKWLYNLDDSFDISILNEIIDNWKPYRSIASLYLWEVINIGLINKSPDSIKNKKSSSS